MLAGFDALVDRIYDTVASPPGAGSMVEPPPLPPIRWGNTFAPHAPL